VKNRKHPAMSRVMERSTALRCEVCRRRLTANSFDFGRALRRGSRSRLALRRGLRRLGLCIADRLGQHRM